MMLPNHSGSKALDFPWLPLPERIIRVRPTLSRSV